MPPRGFSTFPFCNLLLIPDKVRQVGHVRQTLNWRAFFLSHLRPRTRDDVGQKRDPSPREADRPALVFDAKSSIYFPLPFVAVRHVVAPRAALSVACCVVL